MITCTADKGGLLLTHHGRFASQNRPLGFAKCTKWSTYNESYKREVKVGVISRCFFCHSAKEAYNTYCKQVADYKWDLKNKKHLKGYFLGELSFFEYVFNQVQVITGGTKKFWGNIFLYESFLELTVMKKMVDKGFEILNVFDSFYYREDQISEEDFKKLIEESVAECFA